MPAYAPNPANYLGNTIGAAQQTAQAATRQSTEYVVNPKTEQCEAIIGALGFDNKGNATGIKTGTEEIYGIAIYMGGAWHRLTVAGAWTSFTPGTGWEAEAGFQPPEVRHEGERVWFRGVIKTTGYTQPATILTLPVGFRPPGTVELSLSAFSVGALATVVYAVDVHSTGTVTAGMSLLSGSTLALDGLSFNLT